MNKRDIIVAEWVFGQENTPIGIEELSEKHGIHRITIKKWIEAEEKVRIEKGLIDITRIEDSELVTEVIGKVRDKAMITHNSDKLIAKLDNLEEGIQGLALVDAKFHKTIMNLLVWADNQIDDDLAINEWKVLVEHIAKLHSAVFSKGGNNVTVMQQTNATAGGSASEVEKFKGSFRC